MPNKLSAGLLLHRVSASGVLEVLIAHPGGPFWARKDDGAWSIPKGEYDTGDDPKAAAFREFEEEIGCRVPAGDAVELGAIQQPSGKVVTVFALQGDVDLRDFRSNTFEMEWPRGSGRMESFPEVDRAEWFPVAAARVKLLKGQVPFLDTLIEHLRAQGVRFSEQ
ncbi:MAG TPA: NUDIX domain-containing protein [Aeromicrobium sp.]|nr:NUDIX domain-containing protein [Aeromicrobium sp.]